MSSHCFTKPPPVAFFGLRAVRSHDLNRIDRRIIMCMMLIAALALIWNLLGNERGRQLRRPYLADCNCSCFAMMILAIRARNVPISLRSS